MKKIKTRFKVSLISLTSLCLILALFIIPNTNVMAQKKGNVAGRVIDVDTKDYLPGANVMLEGTTFGSATDRSGIYRIPNIAPGTYTLVVSYIGYQDKSVEITIGDQGYTLTQDVEIKASEVKMQEVQIVGLAQGQTKALSAQKNADNIKNVVSEEQMEKFPDINAAEILQRVPGITVQRDQGDGRFVQIRGTEPRLNAMTLNGVSLPSPDGSERQVQLDIIPADQLSSIEVVKAITPDMNGNAIGGAVNLVTKSALDYEKTVLNATLGTGYANLSQQPIFQGAINYGTKFGANQDMGILVGGSYYRADRGSHNNEMEWDNVDDVNDIEIPWALDDLQLRFYDIVRDRIGFNTTFDYRPSIDNSYSITAVYNNYKDVERRHQLRIRPGKGDFNSATDITDAAVLRHMKSRDQVATLYSIMGNGENHFGIYTLDYAASYSYAQEKEDRHLEPTFEMDEDADLTLDLSDPYFPKYTITNLEAGYEMNAENFVLDDMEYHDNLTTDTDISASVNFKMPYSIGNNQSDVKVGGKMSMREKDRDENIWIYKWDGPEDLLMSQFEGESKTDFLNGEYVFGPTTDFDKLESFFNTNKSSFEEEWSFEDSDAGTYNATEDVFAFYAMTTINFDKLMFLVGVRNEITNTSYTGNEVVFDDAGDYLATNPVTEDKTQNNVLPSLHLKYSLNPQTNFRAAFTSGLARPHFEDMTPYSIVLHEDEEIERGNPDLVNTSSYNLDLLAEHYFSGIGVISGGFFYKDLSDIIYYSLIEEDGGMYDGYEVSQPVNGGDATLYGFELNWQQQLSFLPGFLDGLGIFLNYTYTHSEADLEGREEPTLPGQAGNTGNIALSYQKAGFTGQVSLNYHDKYISEVGEDEDHDIYYKEHLQLDISANQRIIDGLSVYLQLVNTTNAPLTYYEGKTSRPRQQEFYSWWMHVGVKYKV
jgi:TonB-dependent receptor